MGNSSPPDTYSLRVGRIRYLPLQGIERFSPFISYPGFEVFRLSISSLTDSAVEERTVLSHFVARTDIGTRVVRHQMFERVISNALVEFADTQRTRRRDVLKALSASG